MIERCGMGIEDEDEKTACQAETRQVSSCAWYGARRFEASALRVELKGRAGEIVFDGLSLSWHRTPGKFLAATKTSAGS